MDYEGTTSNSRFICVDCGREIIFPVLYYHYKGMTPLCYQCYLALITKEKIDSKEEINARIK